MNRNRIWLVAVLAVAAASVVVGIAPRSVWAAPSREQLVALLESIDARQRASGDWRSLTQIQDREKGKVAVAYEALVFRRRAENKFLILFSEPKPSRGQGYLRVDNNLWFYDPAVGKWERRTEREHIGGTNSRRADYDESRFAEQYDPEDGGEEELGTYTTRVLVLRAKAELDLAFPKLKLWVDQASHNVLKRQEFALSGRLLRTSYYPKWQKVRSATHEADVWYAEEVRIYDELEKGNSTIILVKAVDLTPLEANVFTKAWLESKSR